MKKQTKEQVESDKIIIDKFPGARSIESEKIYGKCHTFRLEATDMMKDVSPFKNDPNIQLIPHAHYYHSFDSNGKETKSCNSVGGHFHDIDIYEENGELKGKCSLPKSNKYSSELLAKDRHIHQITYNKTTLVKVRVLNAEAMKMINDSMSRGVE